MGPRLASFGFVVICTETDSTHRLAKPPAARNCMAALNLADHQLAR